MKRVLCKEINAVWAVQNSKFGDLRPLNHSSKVLVASQNGVSDPRCRGWNVARLWTSIHRGIVPGLSPKTGGTFCKAKEKRLKYWAQNSVNFFQSEVTYKGTSIFSETDTHGVMKYIFFHATVVALH